MQFFSIPITSSHLVQRFTTALFLDTLIYDTPIG